MQRAAGVSGGGRRGSIGQGTGHLDVGPGRGERGRDRADAREGLAELRAPSRVSYRLVEPPQLGRLLPPRR